MWLVYLRTLAAPFKVLKSHTQLKQSMTTNWINCAVLKMTRSIFINPKKCLQVS